jgi:ABC-type Zn uptake system ZnuABC Zn-binding protein ZnuA
LKTSLLLIPLLALSCLLASGCGGGGSDSTSSDIPAPAYDHSKVPLKIVVSLPIFADFVKQIAGDQAQVTALIPAGADPQTYVPSADLAQTVADANMIFYNGLNLEPPTEQFINAHTQYPTLVIDFARNVPSPSTSQPVNRPIYAKDVGDNPHLFLDPVLASVYPETVADSLVIKDGQNAAYYNARFQAYRQKLLSLGDEISQKIDGIPAQSRSLLITYQDSMVNFARRYGLSVAGSVTSDGEDALAQVITAQHPPALFAEAGYDDSALQRLAANAGIQVCSIYTDVIDDASMTYIQIMEHDADEIARCLS